MPAMWRACSATALRAYMSACSCCRASASVPAGARQEVNVPENIQPQSINLLGNYAVQITWEDGFNQVASFELLQGLRGDAVDCLPVHCPSVQAVVGGVTAVAELV